MYSRGVGSLVDRCPTPESAPGGRLQPTSQEGDEAFFTATVCQPLAKAQGKSPLSMIPSDSKA